jgi:hypothetical protein
LRKRTASTCVHNGQCIALQTRMLKAIERAKGGKRDLVIW